MGAVDLRAARRMEASDGTRGFALIIVVWFLVLLAAIGTYMMANARSETALAHNVTAAAKAEAVADAAVALSVYNQSEPDLRKKFKLDGTPYSFPLPGGRVTLRLFDETAKINPNFASEKLMAALYQVAGLDKARATQLGAATADWVSSGDQPRGGGAKKAQYEQAGRNYGPPNAPMESLDELQMVLGMTPQLFTAVRPYLTINTGAAAPTDPRKAFDPVRRAMAMAGKDISASQPAQPATAQQGAPGQAGDTPDDRPVAAQQAALPGTAPESVIIEVDATASSVDGGVFVRRAVVKVLPENPKGYTVLDWRRGELAN